MNVWDGEYKILNRLKINGFICMITDSQIIFLIVYLD
jgi:hypothetical protein